jgi:lipooligosaccharide transport system permease protein
VVILFLGIGQHPTVLLVLPVLFFVGMTFASLGLVVNAFAKGYDFFTYYFTLVLTPMIFLSGVYYPRTQLPGWLQALAELLPLSAAVNLVRPIILGQVPQAPVRDLLILAAYCAVGFYAATVLTRRRLIK